MTFSAKNLFWPTDRYRKIMPLQAYFGWIWLFRPKKLYWPIDRYRGILPIYFGHYNSRYFGRNNGRELSRSHTNEGSRDPLYCTQFLWKEAKKPSNSCASNFYEVSDSSLCNMRCIYEDFSFPMLLKKLWSNLPSNVRILHAENHNVENMNILCNVRFRLYPFSFCKRLNMLATVTCSSIPPCISS